MANKTTVARSLDRASEFYNAFDSINGEHPWMTAVENGYVSYKVRELNAGKIAYFNFVLAKEMGLIPADHPHEMNEQLSEKLLKTFSLQIINEYDEISNRKIDPTTIRPNKYMATRYLQLQHANKQGKTSGDGRGIWNGTATHRGTTWDVSSRGTGVTCLAPGAVQAAKPLRTGGTEFGYGCGLAEIDELLSAAISAEVIHLQGINTERVLCVVDLGKGYGIGVRAAKNLIRPAHLFLYLKQERHKDLKAATDYLIDRQVQNKVWNIKPRSAHRYEDMLKEVTRSFAEFTAQLDTDYIFAWLDWDGDNVLADAGIIDYGSVRQFGIRHDKYRYDDVERFSTNLNEQKNKARLIVQVFAQLVDYLKTNTKKPLKDFADHPCLTEFNNIFNLKRSDRILYRMGFNADQRENILAQNGLFNKFDREFSYFERAKISGKEEKVADGVNHPALFNVRNILKEYPKFLLNSSDEFNSKFMDPKLFYRSSLSCFAKRKDMKLGEKHKRHIEAFQKAYRDLVVVACKNQKIDIHMRHIVARSEKLNSEKRITGNALIEMVNELVAEKKRGLPLAHIQGIIDQIVSEFIDLPEIAKSRYFKETTKPKALKRNLYLKLLNLVEEHKESI